MVLSIPPTSNTHRAGNPGDVENAASARHQGRHC